MRIQSPGPDLLEILTKFDLTQIFKTKGRRGDLIRWSAKRTIGGIIGATACQDVLSNGMSWCAVAFALVGIIPLCLSFTENRVS